MFIVSVHLNMIIIFLQTFHTPSLGDEEFEIPPISLDPDSALSVSDVVSHFGELGDGGPAPVVPGNAVVQGNDPSFASTFVNPTTQGLEHLSLMTQQGGGPMLGSTLGMVRRKSFPLVLSVWQTSLHSVHYIVIIVFYYTLLEISITGDVWCYVFKR